MRCRPAAASSPGTARRACSVAARSGAPSRTAGGGPSSGRTAGAKTPSPGRGPTHCSSARHSVSGSIGLVTKPFMPACRQRWRSAAMALAVIATIGKVCASRLSRRWRAAVTPSITGICMSISTRSKGRCWAWWACTISSAFCPLSATSTTKCWERRSSVATCWLSSLSSTSSRRAPAMPASSASSARADSVGLGRAWRDSAIAAAWSLAARSVFAGCAGSGCGVSPASSRRTLNQKVEPWPNSLCTPTSPPMARARLLLMARPRPEPPYSRVVEASACTKLWNRRSICSGFKPMPVSVTAKRRLTWWPAWTVARTDTRTWPWCVNLAALLT